jgi:hypothetical protein
MRRRSNFIASYWSSRPKPTFLSCLSTGKAFGAPSSFAMQKPQKRYLPANFLEAQSWTSTQTSWTQVIMQRWRWRHHLVWESASTSCPTPRKISQKTHILGVILSLVGLCITFSTFTCGSRHDGLAIAEHLESILLLMIAQGSDVGVVVTNNTGNCARAQRILALC